MVAADVPGLGGLPGGLSIVQTQASHEIENFTNRERALDSSPALDVRLMTALQVLQVHVGHHMTSDPTTAIVGTT